MTNDNVFVIEDHKQKQYKMISKFIKLILKRKPFKVILDSGANKTYFNDRKRLTNFQYKRSKVRLGNEATITCYEQGDYGILRNVSYVPDLCKLHTKHLCIDNDFLVNLTKNEPK
jgi:hypothetical protein